MCVYVRVIYIYVENFDDQSLVCRRCPPQCPDGGRRREYQDSGGVSEKTNYEIRDEIHPSKGSRVPSGNRMATSLSIPFVTDETKTTNRHVHSYNFWDFCVKSLVQILSNVTTYTYRRSYGYTLICPPCLYDRTLHVCVPLFSVLRPITASVEFFWNTCERCNAVRSILNSY